MSRKMYITAVDVARFEVSKALASKRKPDNFIITFSHILGGVADIRAVVRNGNNTTCSIASLDISCCVKEGAKIAFKYKAMEFINTNKENFQEG